MTTRQEAGVRAPQKILITGGAGFIGSAVAAACVDAGLVPVLLDNLSTGRREYTEGRIFYEGDIADAPLLDKIFAEHPDLAATVHCAALTVVPESVANPIRHYRGNVTKTVELIEGLVRNGCRRLVFSSLASVSAADGVDGSGSAIPGGGLADSSGSGAGPDAGGGLDPVPYARTKAVMEWILEDVAHAGELQAVALRYFNPIDARVTAEDWPTRDGGAVRDHIHVWDLAEAHVAVLRNFDAIVTRHGDAPYEPVPYEVVNLGTGGGTVVLELADSGTLAVPPTLVGSAGLADFADCADCADCAGLAATGRLAATAGLADSASLAASASASATASASASGLPGRPARSTVSEAIRDALTWARVRAGRPLTAGLAGRPAPRPPEPVVDVLMPYYGDVGMMQEAVRSVLNQRDPHWRLTVVDDGTEPGVPEWFAALIAEHGPEKIRYQRNETNLGITENFQKCLGLVTQQLVTMIGSDDRMLPNYIGTVRALLKAFPQASLAQPGVEVIDENGEVVDPWVDKVKRRVYAPRIRGAAVLGGEHLAISLLRGNWMYFPAICWRADIITEVGFNPELRVVQDLALTLEWVRAGAQIVVGDTVCFQYRRHGDSVSSERAYTGARFAEEGAFFLDEATKMDRLGWRKAARAARLHLSSRLHAATLLPGALRRGSRSGVRTLSTYAFGPSRRRVGGPAR